MAAILTGCDPLEDINAEIDAIPDAPNVGAFEYTLTDEDYDAFDLGFGSFDSEQQAKDSIPDLLTELYPLYGQGSSVLVTYNLYIGAAEGVSDFTGSDVYALSNSDYALTGSDAFGFYPDVDPTDEIPTVLNDAIAAPTEGQVVLAQYDQYTEVPEVGLANVVFYDFAAGFEGWAIVEESGADAVWTEQPGNVRGNGFFGDQFANVEWLVSPSVDLSGEENLKFQITQELDFVGEIESLAIKTLGATGDTDSKGEYFVYEGGSWEEADDVYYLSSADYDSMGEEFGQPGRFDNFSSSVPAADYLDTFLGIKYPFAQEEDQIFVIYKYFSSNSGLGTRGNSYTFTNGLWTAHESTIETSLQFGFDNGVWVPDNTIRYTITQANFDYIEANYAATAGFEDAVSSMANFGNFDRRPSNNAYWSNDMILTVFADLLDNVIASGAADGQKYVISVDIYDGSSGVEEFAVIKDAGEWVYQ